MTAVRRAAVVLSGNELLDGRTIDTNGTTYFVTATVSPDGTSWITGS